MSSYDDYPKPLVYYKWAWLTPGTNRNRRGNHAQNKVTSALSFPEGVNSVRGTVFSQLRRDSGSGSGRVAQVNVRSTNPAQLLRVAFGAWMGYRSGNGLRLALDISGLLICPTPRKRGDEPACDSDRIPAPRKRGFDFLVGDI
jgi:hypothetical protein